MSGKAAHFAKLTAIDRFAGAFVALAVLSPAVAHAQTNLDQGKSPAQIFAIDCAECHKSARGLGKGKDSSALTEFLGEHYTTSREQAAGLATYVLGGRLTEGGPGGPARSAKPATDRANASAEEPRANHQARQRGNPEDGIAAGKPQRSTGRAAKPTNEALPEPTMMSPLGRSETGHIDHRSASMSRSRRKEPKTPIPPQAPVPAQDQSVSQEPAAIAPSTAASMDHAPPTAAKPEAIPATAPVAPPDATSASGESEPVPRDDIPD